MSNQLRTRRVKAEWESHLYCHNTIEPYDYNKRRYYTTLCYHLYHPDTRKHDDMIWKFDIFPYEDGTQIDQDKVREVSEWLAKNTSYPVTAAQINWLILHSGYGFMYTFPYQGHSNFIGCINPDSKPFGYFSDGFVKKEYLDPSDRIDDFNRRIQHLKTRIAYINQYGKSYEKSTIPQMEKEIEMFQHRIVENNENLKSEAKRLIEHRSQYMSRLTPRDRRTIEEKNDKLRVYLQDCN